MALILIVPLVLAACGDDDDDTTGTDGSGEVTAPAGTEGAGNGATWPEDQPITFADFSWDSIIVHNRIMQFIIENGYGYQTDSVSGSTIPMLQSLASNEIQAASEIWVENYPTWQDDLEAGKVLDLGTNYGQSEQGWYVPTYVIEGDPERGIEPIAPDLKSVEDLAEYAEAFQDPENPDKGRFVNGVPGWEAVEINAGKLEAYGLAESFTDFRPGSTAAVFASLTSAYETGEPWFGYLWEPHWVFAQMDMTRLEEPEYTEECWEQIRSGEEACAYPDVVVKVSANAEFGEQVPGIVEMMKNYESNAEKTNNVLLYMQENDIDDHMQAAIWYMQEYPDWTEWVPDDVAEKVQQALDEAAS
jgi:glycine betaine/proline transport system substrate-binding protein